MGKIKLEYNNNTLHCLIRRSTSSQAGEAISFSSRETNIHSSWKLLSFSIIYHFETLTLFLLRLLVWDKYDVKNQMGVAECSEILKYSVFYISLWNANSLKIIFLAWLKLLLNPYQLKYFIDPYRVQIYKIL